MNLKSETSFHNYSKTTGDRKPATGNHTIDQVSSQPQINSAYLSAVALAKGDVPSNKAGPATSSTIDP